MRKTNNESLDKRDIYNALFERTLEGLLVINADRKILLTNPGAEKMLNYSKGELNNTLLDHIVPLNLQAECFQLCDSVFKGKNNGTGIKTTVALLKKNKSKIIIDVSISNHIHSSKGPLMIALFSDITERRQAENKIRKERNLYENVLESMDEIFISLNHEWKCTYINKKGRRILSENEFKDNLTGKVFWEELPQFKGTIYEKRCKKVMDSRIPSIFETTSIIKNSWLEIRVYPHDDGIAIFSKDISEKKKVQETIIKLNEILEYNVQERTNELTQTMEELTQALEREKANNDLKSRFVTMASHEFRTPLTSLLTSVSIIEQYTKSEKNEKLEKHFNRIKSSVHNLTEILNDFLSLDKIEKGKIKISNSKFDLNDVVNDVIEEMKGFLKKGQYIKYENSENIELLQDKKIIHNTLINLLSNASKYSKENSEIELTAENRGKKISLIIKDFGIGIPQRDQNNIFKLFFRAKNAEMIEGTGLGLIIVKKYMDLMGGSIHFTSIENEGSTFVIQFPKNAK